MTDPARTDDIVAKLARAGVITHVARVSDEAGVIEQEAVAALLSLVGHAIFRIAPFVYGIDLARRGGDTAALAGELSTILGDGLIGIDRIETPAAEDGPGFAPIQLLRALSESAEAGCAEAPTETLAVIDAGFALRVAELSAARIAEAPADPGSAEATASRLTALDGSLAALCERIAALERRLDASPPDRSDEILAAIGALGARLPETEEGPAPATAVARAAQEAVDAAVSGLATRLDGLASGDAIAALQAGVDAVGGRMTALETRLLSPATAEPDPRLDALAAAVAEMGAELRDRTATLTGAVEALAARLEAQERTRQTRDETAREREHALRSGLDELAARRDPAREGGPAA